MKRLMFQGKLKANMLEEVKSSYEMLFPSLYVDSIFSRHLNERLHHETQSD